jgi:hypothetical protein
VPRLCAQQGASWPGVCALVQRVLPRPLDSGGTTADTTTGLAASGQAVGLQARLCLSEGGIPLWLRCHACACAGTALSSYSGSHA